MHIRQILSDHFWAFKRKSKCSQEVKFANGKKLFEVVFIWRNQVVK
jgi:hypothetical protein